MGGNNQWAPGRCKSPGKPTEFRLSAIDEARREAKWQRRQLSNSGCRCSPSSTPAPRHFPRKPRKAGCGRRNRPVPARPHRSELLHRVRARGPGCRRRSTYPVARGPHHRRPAHVAAVTDPARRRRRRRPWNTDFASAMSETQSVNIVSSTPRDSLNTSQTNARRLIGSKSVLPADGAGHRIRARQPVQRGDHHAAAAAAGNILEPRQPVAG